MKEIRFTRVAVIGEDSDLTEKVCRHFQRPSYYLPLFEAPAPRMAKWGMYRNDYVRICNAVRFSEPDYILLVGCDKARLSMIQSHLGDVSKKRVIEVSQYSDQQLSMLPGYRATIEFPKTEDIRENDVSDRDVIVVEESSPMTILLARNLAVAENAVLLTIPSVEDADIELITDLHRDWFSNTDSLQRQNASEAIKRFLQARISFLCNARPKTLTFITRGIPYGLLPFRCPTTHLFSFPLLGVSIISGMLKSIRQYLQCPLVYLCDPATVGNSEFESLQKTFGESGYILRTTYGSAATVHSTRYISQHVPLDFIFYATHCGEVRGRRVWTTFISQSGSKHEVVYDRVHGFGPSPNNDLIEVMEMMHWVSIDGVLWSDHEGKRRINAGRIIEEYIEAKRKNETSDGKVNVVRTEDAGVVRESNALAMHDSIFFPALNNVGGYKSPFVFNNSCSSWHQFSMAFSYAGGCAYVGTGCDVANSMARQVAEQFGKHIVKGRSSGYALWKAQERFISDLGYTPYLMHGYIFIRFTARGTVESNWRKVRDAIIDQIRRAREHYVTSTQDEVRRNLVEIISSLEEELNLINRLNKSSHKAIEQ